MATKKKPIVKDPPLTGPIRIIARELAKITPQQKRHLSRYKGPRYRVTQDGCRTDTHIGTCTNEQDCD